MTFGLLRVKNESRWISLAIKSIQPLCEKIIILDDGSTDTTADICFSAGAMVYQKSGMDEPTGKDWLLARLWENGARIGDTVIMIDGDESLCPEDIPNLQAAIDHGLEAAAFRIVYLWDTPEQVRVDGIYSGFTRPSMFRLTDRTLSFMQTGGAGFHCSNVPQQLIAKAGPLPVRLLHYGYMHREDRVRKYCWYNAKEWYPNGDPHVMEMAMQCEPNSWERGLTMKDCPVSLRLEDGYRHMVVGDIFPADSRFCHAGPLRLTPLEEARNSGRWYPKIHGHYDARESVFDPPEMASVLQHHKVTVNGREIRWVWYFDTKEGVLCTYDEQPEYWCSVCGGELYPHGENNWNHEVTEKPLCSGARIELSERQDLPGPIKVSAVSWKLRGRVEVVRK